MLIRLALLVFLAAVSLAGASVSYAQSADNRGSVIPKTGSDDDDDHPKSFKETLVKLRIDKEKKEYEEMLERGEEALKLSEQLERAYDQSGRLNNDELNKLNTVEKLVKKIRNELGGDDDADDEKAVIEPPLSQEVAVKNFRTTTLKLLEELKKTTRFTVSAAAIQASNAVLKLARFLKISR